MKKQKHCLEQDEQHREYPRDSIISVNRQVRKQRWLRSQVFIETKTKTGPDNTRRTHSWVSGQE